MRFDFIRRIAGLERKPSRNLHKVTIAARRSRLGWWEVDIPQIRIEQTYARIGLRIEKPVQEIRQPKAELNLRQEPARMRIERTPPRVEIDQTEAFADEGSKSPFRLTKDWAEEGREALLEGIARIAREGDRLRAIEYKGNPIAEIAYENTTGKQYDFNVAFIPRFGSVKIEGIPGKLEITWELGGVRLNPVIHRPIHHYVPGKVEVYLRQKNQVKIDWVGGIFDESR